MPNDFFSRFLSIKLCSDQGIFHFRRCTSFWGKGYVLGTNRVFPSSFSWLVRYSFTLWKDLFPLLSGWRRNRWLLHILSLLAAIGIYDRWCWRYTCGNVLCRASLYNILELGLSKSVRCSCILLQASCANFARYHFSDFTLSSHKSMSEILLCTEVLRSNKFASKFVVILDLHVPNCPSIQTEQTQFPPL